MPSPAERHAELPRNAERWFDRARAALLDELPCRRGCCRCCIGPFPITARDVDDLRRGLAALAPDQRQAIETRAREQVAAMEAAFPRLKTSPFLDEWRDEDQDVLVARFADRPCPALDADGQCRVYAFRPVTCRMMGIPVETGGLVQGACAVQTAIPIVRLPRALREEEDRLAEQEAAALAAMPGPGEDVLITYGFLPDGLPPIHATVSATASTMRPQR